MRLAGAVRVLRAGGSRQLGRGTQAGAAGIATGQQAALATPVQALLGVQLLLRLQLVHDQVVDEILLLGALFGDLLQLAAERGYLGHLAGAAAAARPHRGQGLRRVRCLWLILGRVYHS